MVRWKEGDEPDVEDEGHVEKVTDIEVDAESMERERAARVDIRESSNAAIDHGKETLMVNASIMTVTYKPRNAPWLVDLDLERAG